MHLAVCNKEQAEWCGWCKLRREEIMSIRALYSLPTGCVLFQLQTSKHGRRYTMPWYMNALPGLACWAGSTLEQTLLLTGCPEWHAVSQSRAYLKPKGPSWPTCPLKDGRQAQTLEKRTVFTVPCIPILRAEDTEKSQTQPLLQAVNHRAPVSTCVLRCGDGLQGAAEWSPDEQRWTYRVRCMGTDGSLHPKVKPKLLRNIFHVQDMSLWKKPPNLMLGIFLCLSVFTQWVKKTDCLWVSLVAF